MNSNLHLQLFRAYVARHTNKTKAACQESTNIFWRDAKKTCTDKTDFESIILNKIKELKQSTTKVKIANIAQYFQHPNEKNNDKETPQLNDSSTPAIEPDCSQSETADVVQNSKDSEEFTTPICRNTPAQDVLRNQISLLKAEYNVALLRGKSNEISKIKKRIESCKKHLRRKKLHAIHSKKHRLTLKSKLAEISANNVDAANVTHSTPGRPRIECKQPELLKTIVDIAMFGASANERRRSEIVRSCQTLSDLHEKLLHLGYQISRSATYLRLMPKNCKTSEGKKHVVTVPVKLSRPEADHHKSHLDQHFCVATIRSLETLASILGPLQACFLSQDDKARVPIGLAAANKQAPVLMHMEYRVSLPDHDWMIAARHKLIPSVYAACVIQNGEIGRPEAVTYSGPSYIAIRSGKHSSSTASTHAFDFEKLITLTQFRNVIKDNCGRVKPVIFVSSDGGPDENPRYPKVVAHAIHHFQKHDLDAIFIFTNAPGRSAFNRVERRMAPLSRELAGVILPHDSFGNHLDGNGKTVDPTLEKINFRKAGEVLAEIWSGMVIDSYEVFAEYIEADARAENFVPVLPCTKWYSTHVRESQYMLQIVKCTNIYCCGQMRSSRLKNFTSPLFTSSIPSSANT
ncbi:PREDICTED: uncharacterized protein LOC108365992 [Rhagoletis zephyria]|uniref:uncharacterized protein LOC108365992 n=1 Tax=Rhagoletis zephyria TaxID=28612 RepID=UPI0008116DAF|nr:PREDICTED: uncharacterized protein LOC108365992 [Rhagoletis zephyria]